jgi:hypothetical protein
MRVDEWIGRQKMNEVVMSSARTVESLRS